MDGAPIDLTEGPTGGVGGLRGGSFVSLDSSAGSLDGYLKP